MDFKIDTKPTYTVITPDTGNLSVNMAEGIRQKIEELSLNSSHNFIINLQNLTSMEMASGDVLLEMHNFVYNSGSSLVFTALEESVNQSMKKGQYHLSLNLTPTLIEAVDIISMETLERDLLGES